MFRKRVLACYIKIPYKSETTLPQSIRKIYLKNIMPNFSLKKCQIIILYFYCIICYLSVRFS